MKRQFIAFLVPIGVGGYAGCAAELTAEGANVRFGKAEPRACRELGPVLGSGGGGAYTSSEDKMRWAQNELRNRTAEMGGNYVALDVAGGDLRGLTLSGHAYRCPSSGVGFPGTDAGSPWARTSPWRTPPSGADSPEAVAAPAQTPAAPPNLTPEERLARLKSLFDRGIITLPEYEARRRQILESL